MKRVRDQSMDHIHSLTAEWPEDKLGALADLLKRRREARSQAQKSGSQAPEPKEPQAPSED